MMKLYHITPANLLIDSLIPLKMKMAPTTIILDGGQRSYATKWLVLVLTAAMVLDHLSIGAAIVDLAFGILFGGIVLALALAVGLGSRDLVSRSLEREAARPAAEAVAEEQFRHF